MLPFTKRAVRFEEDPIHTGDFEVVSAASKASPARAPSVYPPPTASTARPRAFAREPQPSISDEDMTTLLPRKGMTFSPRPQVSVAAVPMAKSPARPRPALEEPPTRQFVVPSTPPPPSVSPVAGPPRASSRPPPAAFASTVAAPSAPPAPQHPRIAVRAQGAPGDSSKSDPKIDPPATVITARTRIIAARPTASWAAALLAMGVFVGLVTAVVARGDADTLIDAAATFVDPSGDHGAAAAGSSLGSIQTKAESSPKTLVSSVDDLLAPADPAAADVKGTASADVLTTPRRPAPVAYAAPVRRASRPVFHTAPKPAPAPAAAPSDDRVAAAPAAAAKPAKGASAKHDDDDVSSGASAADALAKAQLEASLQ